MVQLINFLQALRDFRKCYVVVLSLRNKSKRDKLSEHVCLLT